MQTMEYKIPHVFLDYFVEEASKSYEQDADKRTFAIAIGMEVNGCIEVEELVFTPENGSLSQSYLSGKEDNLLI